MLTRTTRGIGLVAIIAALAGCGDDGFAYDPLPGAGSDAGEDVDASDAASSSDGTGTPEGGDEASPDVEPDGPLTCEDGFADCDQDPVNGCEVELASATSHCGSCDHACEGAAHATPICEEGACALACDAIFGDCDDEPSTGCEVALSDAVENCGLCGEACTAGPNSDPRCTGGSCGLSCHNGFEDCDAEPANGCEIDLASLDNCRGCGVVCGSQNATPSCPASGCSLACDAHFADCNGAAADGCEIDLRVDDENCGWCGHSCAGATCSDGLCEPTIISAPEPGALGVGVDDTYVFWTAGGAQAVLRRPKAGGVAQTIESNVARQRILLDATHLYLGETGEQTKNAYRKAKSGVGNEQLVVGPISATSFAIDDTHFYWTDTANTVNRIPKAGGSVELIADTQSQCIGLAVDATHAYWGRWSDGVIVRVGKTGGTPEVVVTGAGMPVELAVDDTSVFWTDYDSHVFRATKAGGTAQVLAGAQAIPWAIAIDDDRVYWTAIAEGVIRSVAKVGGDVMTLAVGLDFPRQIAVDDARVYFAASGQSDPQAGGVWSVPK